MSVRIETHAEPIPGYKLLERIGSGGFGEVWKAEAPGGIHKAVKIIHGDLRSREHDLIRYAEQELKALKRVKSVRHPYLLALDRFDIIDGRLMIVMELADCNLWDRFRACRDKGLPGIPRDELLLYMQEAAEVLDLMNDQHALQHLDIKPQNLFMLHNHVKVADFGQVKDLQGFMASVTGGITPVYAAPETFDGIVSRYCDQYSLACVYQELLTGIRPFDGTSMSQLLMQHLQLPPNLQPSPTNDRPALARALAKKPEDRWPSVSAFIKALREGENRATIWLGKETATATSSIAPDSVLEAPSGQTEPPGTLPLNINYHDTSQPRTSMETAPPLYQPAPPEVVGNGPIQPTLLLGLGYSGLRVLQHFRFELEERYGSLSHLPAYRTVYIDTDPDTLEEARLARPFARLASLPSSDIIDARINRAAHYMKPRLNGRSLLEGWFDPQLLYKIPRNPTTMGLRIFGRLAFCDQFRAIMAKIHSELDAILTPEALMATSAFTSLEVRTNRPRIYIIAGLAGGTGSGMFIDLAYSLRQRLLRRGYDSPDIIGLFFVPHASTERTPPLLLGNTYAALVELNHYSRSDTQFFAHYDDRNGIVRDKAAPFRRFFLLPTDFPLNPAFNSLTAGGARRSGPIPHPSNRSTPGAIPHPSPRRSGVIGPPARHHITPPHISAPDSRIVPATSTQRGSTPDISALTCPSFAEAAEYLRLNMLTLAGRTIDDLRRQHCPTDDAQPTSSSMAVTSAASRLSLFRWPRGTIVARTASPVARRILKRWIEPDPHRARELVPKWAADYWHRHQWDPEAVLVRFRQAAEKTLGCRLDQFIASATDSLVPRGWLSRLPRPEKVRVALNTLTDVLGPPTSARKRKATPLEEAIDQIVASTIADACHELTLVAPALVEDAEFRLSGAEEVIRQFLAVIDRLLMTCAQQAAEADNQAVEAHNLLLDYSHLASEGGRKPSATEFTRALTSFPHLRFQSITCHRLIALYEALRDPLNQHLHQLGSSRYRLESALRDAPAVVSDVTGEPGLFCHWLMPPECPTIDAAVDRFLAVITHEDLLQIDRRVQQMIEPEYGGLFEASLNSADGPKRIVQLVEQEARAYLDSRLGPMDLTPMLQERYRTVQAAELAIAEAYHQADPALELGSGPWTEQQITVLAAPAESVGEPLRELVQRAVPVTNLTMADAADELTIYRELPAIPITALPQLGLSAAQAYQTLPEIHQCSLHSRLDVAQWKNIDQD